MRFKASHSQIAMSSFLSNQYTKGISVEIPWKDLEPIKNNYNFEKLDDFLSLVTSHNKFLILNININCFNDKCTNGNSPDYIRTDPSYNGGVELLYRSNGTLKGSTARIWDSAVVDRLIILLDSIGKKYDTNPNFLGIILPQETAIGLNGIPKGYSAKNYETQLIRIASAMALNMPRTLGIIGMNYFPYSSDLEATLSNIAKHLVTTGKGAISHPDTYIESPMPAVHKVEIAFNDQLAIIAQFQTWNIPVGTSEEDIYLFATKTLGAHLVMWNPHFTSKYKEERLDYMKNYVLPVINKYKGDTVRDIPQSFLKSNFVSPKLSIIAVK
jgi:hypothetical protein